MSSHLFGLLWPVAVWRLVSYQARPLCFTVKWFPYLCVSPLIDLLDREETHALSEVCVLNDPRIAQGLHSFSSLSPRIVGTDSEPTILGENRFLCGLYAGVTPEFKP